MKTYSNKSSKSGYKTITLTNTGTNTGFNFNFTPPNPIKVKKVIYNNPATIVYFTDGSKTVVKTYFDDCFDEQTGLLMCIAKRFLGDEFHKVLKENVKDYSKQYVTLTDDEVMFNFKPKEIKVKITFGDTDCNFFD